MSHPEWTGKDEVRHLRSLYQLLSTLSHAKTLDEIYQAAITSLLAATPADRAAILMFDEDGVMRVKAWHGLSEEYRKAVTGHTPWRQGDENVEPLPVPDVLLDESLAPFREVFLHEEIRAIAFIPLALDSGVFGKFMLYCANPHQFTADELGIAQAIATHVSLAAERKRADLSRARIERRLHAILDNTATVIFLKDPEGRYTLVNRRFEELFHVTPAEIAGRTDYDLFPPDLAERLRENDRRVLAAGKPLVLEEDVPYEGAVHHYISIKFPLQEPDGSVAGVCGMATDLTERKQLEAASGRLAAIVENSADAIISSDLNGTITSWNQGAEHIFGYTAAEALGRPISMLAVPDRINEMPEILGRIRRGENIEHYETQRRRNDGETIDVSLSISPLRNSAGEIIGASKIARDITDRKAAEREHALLLAREQEARRTAELLNRLAPRLAAELDLQKLIQFLTDTARSLTGAQFGAFFQKLSDEKGDSYVLHTLSGIGREAFEGFPMPRATAIFGPIYRGEGIVRSEDVTQDPRYGKNPPYHGIPKGHPPVRSYLAAPVVSRSGEVLGGLFFGHSNPGKFTEHHEAILAGLAAHAAIAIDNARLFEQARQVQGELTRSNDELKRANQDLEVFAYSASHDLQEPLRNISISAQLLERASGNQIRGESAEFLERILSGANRMDALLQDLLGYLHATKHPEGPAPAVDSGAVLDGALENLRAPIEEAGAVVTCSSLPVVRMHEGRLAQLFQNLIGNAIKYRAAETPRVEISAGERVGNFVFSVTDNGIGIQPQYAGRIFELFHRLHSHERYPGSGLGLAICQRIVEQYGGRIWLEKSEPGKGSTFCFSIPVDAQPQ